MTSSKTWAGRSVILVLVGHIVTGCGVASAPQHPNLPALYQVEVRSALADPSVSSFQKQILEDYWVTDAEYQEATQKYTECMLDAGWSARYRDDSSLVTEVGPAPGGPYDNGKWDGNDASSSSSGGDDTACRQDIVLKVYWGMKSNPEGLSQGQLVRKCFEANDIAEGSDLTNDQFESLVKSPVYVAQSDQAQLCVLDPTGTGGWTLEGAAQIRASLSGMPSTTPVVVSEPSR